MSKEKIGGARAHLVTRNFALGFRAGERVMGLCSMRTRSKTARIENFPNGVWTGARLWRLLGWCRKRLTSRVLVTVWQECGLEGMLIDRWHRRFEIGLDRFMLTKSSVSRNGVGMLGKAVFGIAPTLMKGCRGCVLDRKAEHVSDVGVVGRW